MNKLSQQDHVLEDQGVQEEFVKERLSIPGLKELHNKPAADIAEVLAVVLKSRVGITELHYKVGEFLEITSTVLNR